MFADEIYKAVAKATGEDVRTIAGFGFVLLEPMPASDALVEAGSDKSGDTSDHQTPVDGIDWDDLDLERYLAMCG